MTQENLKSDWEIKSSKTADVQIDTKTEALSKELSDHDVDNLVVQAKTRMSEKQRVVEIKRELGLDPYDAEGREIHGNYSGNWTSLLEERVRHPAYRDKFIFSKADVLQSDAEYERHGALDLTKAENTKKYHYDQIRNLDSDINKVFSSTGYITASETGKSPAALGDSSMGGTVFRDAELRGRSLTVEEKNQVESHEKGHAIRSFRVNFGDIAKGFDFKRMPESTKRPSYLEDPDELIERMSQLKNYFGFKADEVFTRQHLAYAREYYIKDGKLDNNMGDFFSLITKDREDEFLRIINTYPI